MHCSNQADLFPPTSTQLFTLTLIMMAALEFSSIFSFLCLPKMTFSTCPGSVGSPVLSSWCQGTWAAISQSPGQGTAPEAVSQLVNRYILSPTMCQTLGIQ